MVETLTSVHKRVVDSIDGDWSSLLRLDMLKACSGGIGLVVNSGDLGLLRSNLDGVGPNLGGRRLSGSQGLRAVILLFIWVVVD